MEITLNEYYAEIDRAIAQYEDTYTSVEREMAKVEDPEYDATDWHGILHNIRVAVDELYKMKNIHTFERVSREHLSLIFTQFMEGDSSGKIIVNVTHTIRDFDTLRSIERLYGVDWVNILDHNKITTDEFAELDEIIIPVPIELSRRASKEIPVFGDQTGYNILGRDLPNELTEDNNGDLKVLEPVETFAQGMKNLAVAQKGDLPYYEDWGLDLTVGEDWPADTYESVVQLRIAGGFAIDPRVREVRPLNITRQGVSVNAEVEIVPVFGESVTVKPGDNE